jgi:hypothetical protein
MSANAFQLIQQVHAHGGDVCIDGNDLQITAPLPLPDDLVAALRAQKPAVMIALGATFDHAIESILPELKENLPPSLRGMADSKLLVMVNWSIMAAWQRTLQNLEIRVGQHSKA